MKKKPITGKYSIISETCSRVKKNKSYRKKRRVCVRAYKWEDSAKVEKDLGQVWKLGGVPLSNHSKYQIKEMVNTKSKLREDQPLFMRKKTL
jgi:hypothetical protein